MQVASEANDQFQFDSLFATLQVFFFICLHFSVGSLFLFIFFSIFFCPVEWLGWL
jgi:hypothetical protein